MRLLLLAPSLAAASPHYPELGQTAEEISMDKPGKQGWEGMLSLLRACFAAEKAALFYPG